MSWQIRLFELKKVFTSPIILALMGIFLIFNGYLISTRSQMVNQLGILINMVERYGHEINEETIASWEEEHAVLLGEMNERTEEKLGKTFISAMDFFVDFNNQESFTNEEIEQFIEIAVLENYLTTAKEADSIYSHIDLEKKAEDIIDRIGASGELANTIREKYREAQPRIEEIIANGEHRHFFFDGHAYEMHSFLFNNVLRTVTFEIMILVVLLTAFLLSYEFDTEAYLVTYATKCGRKLQLEKLKTALLATSIITVGMLTITLAMYFFVYDYSGLWHVPISSVFMSEGNLFLASFWDMSFLQYLVTVIWVIYMCQLLFVLLVFGLSQLSRSGYLVTILFAIVFGIAYLVPSMFPSNSNFVLHAGFTPFALIFHLHLSFMIAGLSNIYKHYELWTIGVWSLLLLILVLFCYRRFKMEDL